MLYQTLLTGIHPYFVELVNMKGFPEHRHADLELVYCIQGSCDLGIDKTQYHMSPGDLAIIGSMVPHMTPTDRNNDCLTLTIEAGPFLLNEYFDPLSKAVFHDPIFHLSEQDETHLPLILLFNEVSEMCKKPTEFYELFVKGNLCKIFGYVLTYFTAERIGEHKRKALQDVAKIEQALDLIYIRYAEPLTVSYIAEKIGYGKSNFCKIFKQITGTTFHAALNQHRLKTACQLLQNTTLPVDDIAMQVGFSDIKTFCRVFKNTYGVSASVYRKRLS